jgi:hypothetical protein
VLRRLLRGSRTSAAALRRALDDVLRRYGVHPDSVADPGEDAVVVAVFPRSMPMAEITRRLRDELD